MDTIDDKKKKEIADEPIESLEDFLAQDVEEDDLDDLAALALAMEFCDEDEEFTPSEAAELAILEEFGY